MNQLQHTVLALILLALTWHYLIKKHFINDDEVEKWKEWFLDKL